MQQSAIHSCCVYLIVIRNSAKLTKELAHFLPTSVSMPPFDWAGDVRTSRRISKANLVLGQFAKNTING